MYDNGLCLRKIWFVWWCHDVLNSGHGCCMPKNHANQKHGPDQSDGCIRSYAEELAKRSDLHVEVEKREMAFDKDGNLIPF